MSITEQQACKLLEVTPSTLNVYVATRRLNVNRKRTIRGLVVTYDEREVQALKRQLQEDQEYIQQRFGPGKHSSRSAETEFISAESLDRNETKSPITLSADVIERLILLLECSTPSGELKVPVEKKLMLTLPEAVAYSGLSKATLNEAIRAGELTTRKDLGRGHRIKRSEIERYVSSLP
jgi:excisionase family DNA binding protein